MLPHKRSSAEKSKSLTRMHCTMSRSAPFVFVTIIKLPMLTPPPPPPTSPPFHFAPSPGPPPTHWLLCHLHIAPNAANSPFPLPTCPPPTPSPHPNAVWGSAPIAPIAPLTPPHRSVLSAHPCVHDIISNSEQHLQKMKALLPHTRL